MASIYLDATLTALRHWVAGAAGKPAFLSPTVIKTFDADLVRSAILNLVQTVCRETSDVIFPVIQSETRLEKKSATETLTPILEKDGRWKVDGCYIK